MSHSAIPSAGTSKPRTTVTEPGTTPVESRAQEPLDDIRARRLRALLDRYPSLPMPIATAMINRAAEGPVGLALTQLEQALGQLNDLPDLNTLSGSEIRMLDVTLNLISSRITELQNLLNHVWERQA